MAKKIIDPAPIIKDLAEWCLKAKGLECSVLGSVIDKLKAAPRVDAVEVVRCKGCHYYEDPTDGDALGRCTNGRLAVSYAGEVYPEPDYFCAYGERKRQ